MQSQRRPQSLAHDSPCASFVAKGVTPAASAREFAAGIAAQRDRPGSCDGHDSRLRRVRSGQRDGGVVDNQQSPATNDLAENRLLAVRSTGEPETGRRKFDICRRQTGVGAGAMQSAGYCLNQTLAALRSTDMIRLSSRTLAQYMAGAVADQCPGAGLASIHPEKILLLCRHVLSSYIGERSPLIAGRETRKVNNPSDEPPTQS
jgi:hypothetical protein